MATRTRRHLTKWIVKQPYILYSDWKGNRDLSFSVDNGYLDKFIHKKTKLLTVENDIPATHRILPVPRFDPKITQGFLTAQRSFFSPSAPISHDVAGNNYWLSLNAINWDRRSIYIKGTKYLSLDNIITCCMPTSSTVVIITQPLGLKYVIGKYQFNGTDYILMQLIDFNPVGGVSASLVGFKTDSINLVVLLKATVNNTSNQAGLYRYEFSTDYTSFTSVKLADSTLSLVHVDESYNNNGDVFGENPVWTSHSSHIESLVTAGIEIVDIFYYKDFFTVIVFKVLTHDVSTIFNRDSFTGGPIDLATVNTSDSKTGEYWSYSIDFATDTIVSVKKIKDEKDLKIETGLTSFDGNLSVNNQEIKDINESDISSIIYADYVNDIYVYRKAIKTKISTWVGRLTIGVQEGYNTTLSISSSVIMSHKGINTSILSDTLNKDLGFTIGWLINTYFHAYITSFASMFGSSPRSSTDSNTSDIYYPNPYNLQRSNHWAGEELYNYKNKHSFAFDGTLLVFSCEAFVDNITSFKPTSIIYNIKTKEMQKINYMLDFENNHRNSPTHPFTLTKL